MQKLYIECLNRSNKTIDNKVFMLRAIGHLVMNTMKDKSVSERSYQELLGAAKERFSQPVFGINTYDKSLEHLTVPLMDELKKRLDDAVKQADPLAPQYHWMEGDDQFMLVIKELTKGLVDSISFAKDEVVDTADANVKNHNLEVKIVEGERTWVFEVKTFGGVNEIIMGDWFVNNELKPRFGHDGEAVWLFSLFKQLAFFMATQKEVDELSELMGLN